MIIAESNRVFIQFEFAVPSDLVVGVLLIMFDVELKF